MRLMPGMCITMEITILILDFLEISRQPRMPEVQDMLCPCLMSPAVERSIKDSLARLSHRGVVGQKHLQDGQSQGMVQGWFVLHSPCGACQVLS